MADKKQPWNDDTAVAAFNEALRKSADPAFRKRLLDKKDAKAALSEVGNVDIPDDIVIRFYNDKDETGDVFCVGLQSPEDPPKEFKDSVFCTYSTWAFRARS
jgi:hypothetical protein